MTRLITTCFFTSILLLSSNLVLSQTSTERTDSVDCKSIRGCLYDVVVSSFNEDSNYAEGESLTTFTWTNGGGLALKRFYFTFDLSFMQSQSLVTEAYVSLFFNPTDELESFDTHFGINDSKIMRVTSEWDVNQITWGYQPSTTLENHVSLPQSSSDNANYINLDVTNLVSDMQTQGNWGFMMSMTDELNPYRGLLFASSDHPNSELHPEIEVCYTVVTGINVVEYSAETELILYPNPSNGTFRVVLPQEIDRFDPEFSIKAFDLSGKLIKSFNTFSEELTLDQEGVFLIVVSDGSGNIFTKTINCFN
ncbi:MAG: hypothetical protein COA49_03470 [Bacteroidetes bacterium]|nr:MAG: hypothetical protein COA49_03470 [Bacteroidota bacterium]